MSQELREARSLLQSSIAIIDKLLGEPTRSYAGSQADGIRMIEKNSKIYVEIDNREWFLETCHILKVHPKADARDVDAMASLPSGLGKYGSLTDGQWKLFKAIHNKLLGRWPEVPAKAAAPVTPMTEEDMESIPF